jgi:hypothetical protein
MPSLLCVQTSSSPQSELFDFSQSTKMVLEGQWPVQMDIAFAIYRDLCFIVAKLLRTPDAFGGFIVYGSFRDLRSYDCSIVSTGRCG